MNKIFVLTSLIIFCTHNLGISQIDYNHRNAQARLDAVQYSIKNNYDGVKNAKGSPYINKNFEAVKIKKFGDKIFAGRYDANLGEMQIKRENDTIALNNAEDFEITFVLTNKTYKTQDYRDKDGALKRGFLVVLSESDSLAILKKEVIKFYEEKPSSNGYDKGKPAEYRKMKDEYFFRIGNTVALLPQKRKEFLKVFPEHTDKLKIFIKENKIDLKEDEDLITLFKYIETIL
jgi:hypothetical protein